MQKILIFLLFLLCALQSSAQTIPELGEALNNRARYDPHIKNNKSNHVGIMVDTAFRHAGFVVETIGFQSTADGQTGWLNVVFKSGAPVMQLPVALVVYDGGTFVYSAEWVTRANTPTGIRCQIGYNDRPRHGQVFVLAPFGTFQTANEEILQKPPAQLMEGAWISGPRDFSYPPPSIEDLMAEVAEVEIASDVAAEEMVMEEVPPPVKLPMETATITDPNHIFNEFEVDVQAAFPGGEAEMQRFIAKNLNYPAKARKNGIQGMVVVRFVVEKDGSLSNLTTMRDVGGGCGEEAIRMVKNMPKWTPAQYLGHAVRFEYTLIAKFRLE